MPSTERSQPLGLLQPRNKTWPSGGLGPRRTQSFVSKTRSHIRAGFLTEFFGQLLGYRAFGADDDGTFELKAESASTETAGGQTPDGQLGFFSSASQRTVVVIELKAPGADLDAKQHRTDRRTPVEQGFGYVSKFDGCRWVIVSNFVTIRLYWTVRGEAYYWDFDVAALYEPSRTAELIRVLHRDNLLGQSSDAVSPTAELAEQSRTDEIEITEAFYVFFKKNRAELFHALVTHNPPAEGRTQVEHEISLLKMTQTILDRLLFICFAEDTDLLPRDILNQALDSAGAGFTQTNRWQQLTGLFDSVNVGNPARSVFGYNGGLFAHDPGLAALTLNDESLDFIYEMSSYDYSEQLGVVVLGRVFERSIVDIEALHVEIDPTSVPAAASASRSKRSQEGVFYTPDWVTRFLATETLGAWTRERFEEMRRASGVDRIPSSHTARRSKAEQAFWETWQNELRSIKVLDPACGSGAFLVAVFDALYTEYDRANRELAAWRGGQTGLFDPDKDILESNLYGVDINSESVEITRLSLWLKTARRGRPLTTLANTIRNGNSLIDIPAPGSPAAASFERLSTDESRSAFDWHNAFPEVFDPDTRPAGRTGFDIVVGNPPYVRGEWLSATSKDFFSDRYQVYGRRADLLVYFYERSIELMGANARLGFIVSNKWLKAGYGEPLRRYLHGQARLDSIIDFGHAPIFQDADTFPVMTVLSTPAEVHAGSDVNVAVVPREELGAAALSQLVVEKGYSIPSTRFTSDAWSLERGEVHDLLEHIGRQPPLGEVAGDPYFGIKTGYNDAYIIDRSTRDRLITKDPHSNEIIHPMVRGSNIHRWTVNPPVEYMIGLASSDDRTWPWTKADDPENVFRRTYPGIYEWLTTDAKPNENRHHKLVTRSDQGRHWWELRKCAYYERLAQPKLLYTDIAWQPEVAIDTTGLYVNNSAYFLPGADAWTCAVLNSPVIWWYAWRTFQHGKDEVLRWFTASVRNLPIASPSNGSDQAVAAVPRLSALADERQQRRRDLLAWLRVEFNVVRPSRAISDPSSIIDLDDLIAEARDRGQGQMTSAKLGALAREHETHSAAGIASLTESIYLEQIIADAVVAAYDLTSQQRTLLQATAPPRTPLY